jgi:ATP-dependent Lon protease
MLHNPVSIAELAIEKKATTLLVPLSARRQLFDLPDELAAKIDIQYYTDIRDALMKSLAD